MAFTIPTKGSAQSNFQSVAQQQDFEILVAGINGIDCVLSGCAVTAQGSPDMTVAVAKGAVLTNGLLKAVAAANGTITTANGTNPRIDLVVITSAGAIAVRAGTAAAVPIPPTRSANDVVIAMVYIPASDTTIASDQIVDKRVIRQQGPILIGKNTALVTQNTSATAVTMITLTIPSGLFLAGRVLRGRLGGNYLANSGVPTWTLIISYGGTTIFSDVTSATAAEADRGAWHIDFDILASANAAQNLSGEVSFSPVTAVKVPASTGTGDLLSPAAVANVNIQTPIHGTAAVDSDAADRILLVTWTMSVSNAADETVCSFATVELM